MGKPIEYIQSQRSHFNRKVVLFVIGFVMFAAFLFGAAGCSPKAAEQSADGEENGAGQKEDMVLTDFSWSKDLDCDMCHTQEVETRVDEKCLASVHAVNACIDCHSDEAGLSDVHKDVDTVEDPEKGRLWKTSVDDATCIGCHESWEALAVTTAADTTLTDAQGLTVNPHQIPEGGDHDEIYCASCHVMHKNDPSVIRRQCVSCHHAEVWECGTCHTYVPTE